MGSDFPLAAPINALITVGNVEEKVLFVMLLRKGEIFEYDFFNTKLNEWVKAERVPGTRVPWWQRWVE